ncbi:helix-turn-helix transcriptional regulator [Thiotrichales bacterium 19X7-9]|nr:helix-turn-helix transcriptional regulator [Thiotrichales bacterium 19X7-9]
MQQSEIIKNFCQSTSIPLLICNNQLDILYSNTIMNSYLSHIPNKTIKNQLEALIYKNCNHCYSNRHTQDHTIKLKWNLYQQLDNFYYITIKAIEKKPIVHTFSEGRLLNQLIQQLPASVHIKDTSGAYLYANAHHTKAAKSQSIINQYDTDLPWDQSADKFRAHYQKSLELDDAPYYFTETQHYKNEDGQMVYNTMLCAIKNKDNQSFGMSVNLAHIHKSLFLDYIQSVSDIDQSIDLSPREMECVHWLVEGKSSSEIAVILGITKKTVEWHIANIKQKFGCYKLSKLSFLIGKYHGWFFNRLS